jgi:hypothetical protein
MLENNEAEETVHTRATQPPPAGYSAMAYYMVRSQSGLTYEEFEARYGAPPEPDEQQSQVSGEERHQQLFRAIINRIASGDAPEVILTSIACMVTEAISDTSQSKG